MLTEPNLVPYADVTAFVLDPLRAVGLDDQVLAGCRLELYATPHGTAVHDDVRCPHLDHQPGRAVARVLVSLLEAAGRACECCRPHVLWARAHYGGWSLLRLQQDAAELARRLTQLETVPAYAVSGAMRVELEEMIALACGRPGAAFRVAATRCQTQLAALARIDTPAELALWGRRYTMVAGQPTPPGGSAGDPAQLAAWWHAYGTYQPARWVRRGPLAALARHWDAHLPGPAEGTSLVALTPGPRGLEDGLERRAGDALWRWFGAGVRFKVVSDDALALLDALAATAGAGLVRVACASPAAAEVAASLYLQLRDVERCVATAAACTGVVPGADA